MGIKLLLKHQDLQMFGLKSGLDFIFHFPWFSIIFYDRGNSENQTNMSNFHPLEVVSRGSETQLQVGENSSVFKFSALTPT